MTFFAPSLKQWKICARSCLIKAGCTTFTTKWCNNCCCSISAWLEQTRQSSSYSYKSPAASDKSKGGNSNSTKLALVLLKSSLFYHFCATRAAMNARRLSQQKLNEQVQSDDEDVGEFEYEDFPTMPEFLRQTSPYSATSQRYEGRSYKPLGRKRYRESILMQNKFILELLITPKLFDSKCWRLP